MCRCRCRGKEQLADLPEDEMRELARLPCVDECVKADRPGIKFVPEDRVVVHLVVDWPPWSARRRPSR